MSAGSSDCGDSLCLAGRQRSRTCQLAGTAAIHHIRKPMALRVAARGSTVARGASPVATLVPRHSALGVGTGGVQMSGLTNGSSDDFFFYFFSILSACSVATKSDGGDTFHSGATCGKCRGPRPGPVHVITRFVAGAVLKLTAKKKNRAIHFIAHNPSPRVSWRIPIAQQSWPPVARSKRAELDVVCRCSSRPPAPFVNRRRAVEGFGAPVPPEPPPWRQC